MMIVNTDRERSMRRAAFIVYIDKHTPPESLLAGLQLNVSISLIHFYSKRLENENPQFCKAWQGTVHTAGHILYRKSYYLIKHGLDC